MLLGKSLGTRSDRDLHLYCTTMCLPSTIWIVDCGQQAEDARMEIETLIEGQRVRVAEVEDLKLRRVLFILLDPLT